MSAISRLLFFLLANAFLAKARQRSQFFEVLLKRTRRSSPINDSLPAHDLVAENAASGSKDHARLDLHMIADADLTSDDCAVPDSGAAGDSSLSGDHNIFTDLNV